jgi:S1-C subfamily serine protease
MSNTTYSLEWRGAVKSGLTYEDIEAGLVSGDLHTLYKIQVNGRRLVLRDFVEQQRPLLAPPPVRNLPPQLAGDSLPRPDLHSSAPPPPPMGKAVPSSLPPPAGHKAAKPVWFWPAIILSSTVCILIGVVFVYMSATSRSATARVGDSATDISSPTTSAKTPSTTDAARDKSIPPIAPQHDLNNEEIANLKSPYVVKISTRWFDVDKEGKQILVGGNGSGVLIKHENGHAYFVTNRHVVAFPDNIEEVKYSLNFMGADHPFEVVKLGRYDLDLAMLRIEYSDAKAQPPLNSVKLENLKPGQECVAIGNALGQGISVTTGVISAFDEWEAGKYVRTSAPISSGNSGGGLFRTKDGALIGITTLGSGSAPGKVIQNVNRAIPMDYVLSDLFWENF